MNINGLTEKHVAELGRNIVAGNFETNPDGRVLVRRMGASFQGSYRVRVNDIDPSIEHNKFVTQGLVDILLTYFKSGAQTATFYLAPFSGDVNPLDGWTGASFASLATELTTQYSETTRRPITFSTPTTTPTINNTASLSVFTIAAVTDIYGMGMLTTSTKGGITGKLISAGLFDNPRLALAIGDKLSCEYVIDAEDGT